MEQEVKLAIDDPRQLNRLRNSHWFQCLFPSATQQVIQMHSCYLDTPERRLSAADISLRLRRENEKIVLSVKSTGILSGSVHQREEWSAIWTGSWPPQELSLSDVLLSFERSNPQALRDAAWPLRQDFGRPADLMILCEIRFQRLAAQFTWQGLTAEAALDQGWLLGPTRRQSLQELEIEYLAGDVQQLSPLAAQLMAEFDLRFEPQSKLYRCLSLQLKETTHDGIS